MRGVGKHIYGLDAAHAVVAVPLQVVQIARERFGIAGDVHDSLGRELYQRVQKRHAAAGARRVHHHHVQVLAFLGDRLHKCACIALVKADILQTVCFGVLLRVAHRVAVELHANHLPGAALGGNNANGADAAVGVQHGFVSL